MVSAAPGCDPRGQERRYGAGLLPQTAAAPGAVVIAQLGWPGGHVAAIEPCFDRPNIAIFVAAGDDGFNDQRPPQADYPGTSAHVIAVGATRLVATVDLARLAGRPRVKGGGARAAARSPSRRIRALAVRDEGDRRRGRRRPSARGLAGQRGWAVLGGTSASAPFVAAIFAAGHGAQTSGASSRPTPQAVGRHGGRTAPVRQTLLCTARSAGTADRVRHAQLRGARHQRRRSSSGGQAPDGRRPGWMFTGGATGRRPRG
jgi:hypothetical protein